MLLQPLTQMHSKAGSPRDQDGDTTYLRTLNLRDIIEVDLTKAFSDEDLINNDKLSYSVSRDGINWSETITGLRR